jgi:hypothetical protein
MGVGVADLTAGMGDWAKADPPRSAAVRARRTEREREEFRTGVMEERVVSLPNRRARLFLWGRSGAVLLILILI